MLTSVSVMPASVAVLCSFEFFDGVVVRVGLDAQNDKLVGAASGLLIQQATVEERSLAGDGHVTGSPGLTGLIIQTLSPL